MDILFSNTHSYTTDDLRTICSRGCRQHHDEPLSHSCNSQNKELVQLEDRKRSMNFKSGSLRLQFTDVLSQERSIEFEEQIKRRDMKHFHLQRAKLVASKIEALMTYAASWIEDLPCLQIDFFAHKGKNKSKVFLSQGMQGYNTIPCMGTQRSKMFHSKRLLISMALNYAGLRQRSRDSHIEHLQRLETLYSAGSRQSDKSHSYWSESQPRPKTFNHVSRPTPDNSYYYETESLRGPKTLQDEGVQKSDKLSSHSFNDSTLPPVEGTQLPPSFLQNALQILILQISMLQKIVRQNCHVAILMVILTQAACTEVQVPINCTSAFEMTSPNYPSPYQEDENIQWSVTAPEGKMILLTFNNFSLGPSGEVKVIENLIDRKTQRYGGEDQTIPPFLSRKNSLVLRFTSDEAPTRKGFNISASCYGLSGTRVGRLVDGNTPAEGFLELQAESGAQWNGVCEDSSADRLADVVCGELGFPGANEVSYEQGWCSSEGGDPVCFRAHSCENNTYRSQDCSASSNKCNSSMAVKVKCFEPGFIGCYDLGSFQLQNGSPHKSTSQCITSCRQKTPKTIAIIKASECFCYDDIRLSSLRKVEARSCAPHQLFYNASVGFCNQTDDVMNGSWDSDATWFGSIVHLTCDAGYRLKGNGTLQCVTKMSSYVPVWNGSFPTCELITNITSRNSGEMTPTQDSEKKRLINAAIAISSSMPALICVICAVVWTRRRRKIKKQRAGPATTSTGESDLTNRTRALPRTPIAESQPTILLNRSQYVTRSPHYPNNSSTLHPSLELTALQRGNNTYASGNPYHYAISMTHTHQSTPNMDNHVNTYELGESIDRNANGSESMTEMMPMFNRPLPHRPISVGVQEGPSLPPRERHVIHSSTLFPNLTQNTTSDNSQLGACSLNHNSLTNREQQHETVVSTSRTGHHNGSLYPQKDQIPQHGSGTQAVTKVYPFIGTTPKESADHGYYSADDFKHDAVHNGSNVPLSPSPSKLDPFYHCLENDAQQMNHCDTVGLIANQSNVPDGYLADVMIDNVLYNPMDF